MDPNLLKAVNPAGIFVSVRGAKTLNDMLVHSKLPVIEKIICQSGGTLNEIERRMPASGCTPCVKKCALCKNFLKETKTVYSFHANSVFNIHQSSYYYKLIDTAKVGLELKLGKQILFSILRNIYSL